MTPSSWTVKIEGQPQSQMRHRHRKAGRRIITYDPSSKDKKTVEEILGWKKPKQKFTGPLKVEIIAWFKTPTSYSQKKTDLVEDGYRPKKPDADNIAKFYYDCMNDIIYDDDNQIVVSVTEKRYSTNPRVFIRVTAIA